MTRSEMTGKALSGSTVTGRSGLSSVAASATSVLFRKRISALARKRIAHRDRSEPACFRRFLKAAASGDPVPTVQALLAWLDRRQPGGGTYGSPPPLSDLAAARVRSWTKGRGLRRLVRERNAGHAFLGPLTPFLKVCSSPDTQ